MTQEYFNNLGQTFFSGFSSINVPPNFSSQNAQKSLNQRNRVAISLEPEANVGTDEQQVVQVRIPAREIESTLALAKKN